MWTRTHREEPVGRRGGGQCCSRTAPGAGGGCRSRGGASPTGPGEQRPWHTPTSDFWPQSLGLSPHAVDSLLQQPPETHTHALVWSLVLARATGPSPARPARFFLPCPRPQQTRPQQTRPQDRSSSRSAHPRDWAASASLGFLPGRWPLRRKLPTRTDVPGVPSLSRLVATTALGDRCPGEGRFAAVSENSREPIQRSGRPAGGPAQGANGHREGKPLRLQECSLRGRPSRRLHGRPPPGGRWRAPRSRPWGSQPSAVPGSSWPQD